MRAISADFPKAAGVAIGLLACGTAHAQERQGTTGSTGGERSPAQIEEIVVTAQKRHERLQDIPLAVTALTAAKLDRTQLRDTTDLTALVPNLEMYRSSQIGNGAIISLRGISSEQVEKSYDPGVAVLVDGVYLSTSTGQIVQSFDFERIEVLRGPQGTLFGKNTTGGVVNIVRAQPDPAAESASFKAELLIGSHGRLDSNAVFLAPVVQEKVAIKLGAFIQTDHGAFKNVNLGHHQGDKDYKAGTVSVVATPNDLLKFSLTYDLIRDNSELPAQLTLLTPNPVPTPITSPVAVFNGQDTPCANPTLPLACLPTLDTYEGNTALQVRDNPANYDLDAITALANLDLGSVQIVSVTGARSSDDDGMFENVPGPYSLSTSFRNAHIRDLSEELRLESSFDGPVNFTFGAYYFDSHIESESFSDTDLAATSATSGLGAVISSNARIYTQEAKSYALFGQANYDLTNALTFTAGFRQTWDSKAIDWSRYSSAINLRAPGTFVERAVLDDEWNKFSPKLALDYKINPDALLYVSWSRGYNAGGYNGGAPNTSLLGPYEPETIESWELGAKTQWLDRRFRLNAAAFFSDFSDKLERIVTVIPVPPFTGALTTNISSVRINGLELETEWIPVEGLRLDAAVGYLDAKYSDFTAQLRNDLPVTDNTVLKPLRSPEWTLSGSADHEFTIGDNTAGLNAGIRWVDEFFLDVINDPRGRVASTTYVDLSARLEMTTWSHSSLQISAFVKNLTDATPLNRLATGARSFIAVGSQQLGRQYGLKATWRY